MTGCKYSTGGLPLLHNGLVCRRYSNGDFLAIGSFFRRVDPGLAQYRFPERWLWQYQHNPAAQPRNQPTVWLVFDGSRVVGMAAILPARFKMFNSFITAGWCVDFHVLPEFRGLGIGRLLQHQRQAFCSTFSMGMSPSSRAVKTNTGQTEGPPVDIYVHSGQPDRLFLKTNLLDSTERLGPLGRPSQRVIRRALNFGLSQGFVGALCTFPRSPPISASFSEDQGRIRFEQVQTFPESAGKIWGACSKKYDFAVHRSVEYLNWKYFQQPWMNYEVLMAYREDRPSGVLVVRVGKSPEPSIGVIADIFTPDGSQMLAAMLFFALNRLYSQGARIVKCASSNTEYSRVLRNCGFRLLRRERPVFSLSQDLSPSENRLSNAKWFLQIGDPDMDLFPTARHPSFRELLMAKFGPGTVAD